MLQKPIVRAASAVIHVAFIALLLWFAWGAFQSREPNLDDETGTINRIFAAVAAAIATFMAIGLILWLRKGRVEALLIPDNVLLLILGFVLSLHLEPGFVVCFLALVAAEAPVLFDPRTQRAAPPANRPAGGPGAPPNPPAGSAAPERPKTPPTN